MEFAGTEKSPSRLASTTSRQRHRPLRPCKHCAVSARRKSQLDSRILLLIEHLERIDPKSSQEIGETRIGMQTPKFRIKGIARCRCRVLFDCTVHPSKCI